MPAPLFLFTSPCGGLSPQHGALRVVCPGPCLLQALKHPHIISVVGSEKRNMGPHTEFYILMEYAEKSLLGMMQERHAENRRFSEKEVRGRASGGGGLGGSALQCSPSPRLPGSQVLRIFSDIVSAVAHCHSQNPPVAHRDLKACCAPGRHW